MSQKMGSRSPSKSVISESNSWGLGNICQNSVNLDDMMLSIKQSEDIRCNVCNTKTETLKKREELAWQREDVIHTREKELREWELMLEEKNKLLIEKERQLNEAEKVVKIEAVHETNENSRKSSIADSGVHAFTLDARSDSKIEFLLEKEKLLTEIEKINSEKVKNIEEREQSIIVKEQLLSAQRINDNKERELAAQKNLDLEFREQVVKKIEVALERKFKDICEEKKSFDNREKLLAERENALSSAAEIVKEKERILNEHENMIIEKERNVIERMCAVSKLSESECSDRKNDELLRKLDGIFEDKRKSVQQRETAVNHSELVLQERWKEYTEAQGLLKSEEENLLSIKSTFEKEKKILREWEKLLQKQEDKFQKHKVIEEGPSNKIDSLFFGEKNEGTWRDSSLDIHRKETRQQGSSLCAATSSSNGENDLKCSDTSENINLFNKASCLENEEIAGDDLLQFYEQEKKLLQSQLFEEKAEISTNEQFSNAGKNVERNSELTESVETFFKNTGSVKEGTGILLLSSNLQTYSITEIMKEVSKQQTATNKIDVIQGSDNTAQIGTKTAVSSKKVIQGSDNRSQIAAETAVSSKDGNKSQNLCNNAIREGEKKKTEDNSCLKNSDDPSNKKSTSPVSSASSTRSLTSPVGGLYYTGKRQKKPPKDALLQAISEQNSLETVQLLNTNCMSLEVRDNEGRSAILLAVKYGNIDLVKRLIDKGADIRACDYKGASALHIAIVENNPEMVLFLLKRGLNPRVTDISGRTAVQLASKLQHSYLIDIINNFNTATST